MTGNLVAKEPQNQTMRPAVPGSGECGLKTRPRAKSPIQPPAEILALAAQALLKLGRIDLARGTARLALTADEACASAHSVLAVAHDELGEWREGQLQGRRAVELLPTSPQLRYNLALSTLRLDDYAAGFGLHEARIDKPDWTGLAIAPSRLAQRHRLLRPGQPVEGRRILVVIEQGLGDRRLAAVAELKRHLRDGRQPARLQPGHRQSLL